jgi:hypothetical protein
MRRTTEVDGLGSRSSNHEWRVHKLTQRHSFGKDVAWAAARRSREVRFMNDEDGILSDDPNPRQLK